MLISSAVFITLCIPIAGSFALLAMYMPAVILLGIAAIVCFREAPVVEDDEPEEE